MSEQMEKDLVTDSTEEITSAETAEISEKAEADNEEAKEGEEKRYPSYRERKRLKQEERRKKKEEEQRLMSDIAVAQAELNALKKEYGLEEEEKGIKKAITNFFDRKDEKKKVLLNKKKYIWLAVLLGWVGGHRFYSKQYLLGLIYLVLFWSGVPIAMTIIDLMVIIPMKPDEDGNVLI